MPLDSRLQSTGNRTSVTWQMRPRPDTPGENSTLTCHSLLPFVARSGVKPTGYSVDHVDDVVGKLGMLIRFDINEQISAANDDQVSDDDKYLR